MLIIQADDGCVSKCLDNALIFATLKLVAVNIPRSCFIDNLIVFPVICVLSNTEIKRQRCEVWQP